MNQVDEKHSLKDIKLDLRRKGQLPTPKNNKTKIPEFISYSAIVLKDVSKKRLLDLFKGKIPKGWKVLADHMTINMGKISDDAEPYLGMSVNLYGVDYAMNDRVLCLGVDSGSIESKNSKSHITIAINERAGAKPKESNDIPESEFIKLKRSIRLSGYVKEIPFTIKK